MADKIEPVAALTDQFVDLLNQLLELDPAAVQDIMLRRVVVEMNVSKQTEVSCVVSGATAKTSALGIINGVLTSAGQPMVAMVMNTQDKVEAFTALKPKPKVP